MALPESVGRVSPFWVWLKYGNKDDTMSIPQTLWIDPYYRIVAGTLQHVRGHFRSWPRRQRPYLTLVKTTASVA